MDAIDVLAIILSVVSLIVTVVGFFASLKFYRDGVELQGKANDALTKIEEKTAFIQTQVGGMFDKTLDAAIGKRVELSENFSELTEQLEQTSKKIIEESIKQIGGAGEAERKRVSEIVNNQMGLIRKKVETTRELALDAKPAKDIADDSFPTYREAKKAFDKDYFEQLMKRVAGNKEAAARHAGMSRSQFYEKWKEIERGRDA